MADRYQGALNQVEIKIGQDLFLETHPRLLKLTANLAGKTLSHNDALQLYQLFFEQYRRQDRPVAVRYCVLEMERIMMAKQNPEMQVMYPLIDFSGKTRRELSTFVSRKRSLYQHLQRKYLKRWTIEYSIVLAALMPLLVLVLHLPFLLMFGLLLVLWFVLQWYGIHKRVPNLIQRNMKSYYKKLDEEQRTLIKSWKIKTPPVIKRKKKQSLQEISSQNSSLTEEGSVTREFEKPASGKTKSYQTRK